MWMSATIEKAILPLDLIINAEINIENEYQQVNINLLSNVKKFMTENGEEKKENACAQI